MIIDWFTVGAQALNFVILVWLMKRFLYKPIIGAIDAREKLIEKKLSDAKATRAAAKKESEDFKHKNEEFDLQRAALMSEATDAAQTERQRLLGEARDAADELSVKRRETLAKEANELSQAISRQTRDEVFAIARKALTDLATVSLEERICDVFIRRLRAMDDEAKSKLRTALEKSNDPVLVRSAFELPTQQRTAIQDALDETFGAKVHVRFETASDLVAGIEFFTQGQKVTWSIANYLVSLEKSVEKLGGNIAEPEHEPEREPEPDARDKKLPARKGEPSEQRA